MRRSVVWPAVALALVVLSVPGCDAGCTSFSDYEQRGWVWMYLGSFGYGFLTSLTPCVYPMIPITLGIFGARGKDVNRGRALMLATAYVVGMGFTYATLGVIVAKLGAQFGTILNNPFVVIPIVLLFAALAASMFGAFELNLPAAWQARLNQVGGQGYRGAFAMGMVGGLVAAPCTGPFLLSLLAFAAKGGNGLGGGSLLFVYALGMGVLFWLLAAFAMSLPKSGRWMEWVKSAGGVLLLLGGIYFLTPLLPFMRQLAIPQGWFLGAALAVIAVGLALGAIHLSFHAPLGEKLRKGVGIALVIAGAFAAWSYKLTPKHKLPYLTDEAAAFAKARAEHKGVMVDFAATWCLPCRELELTFGDDDIYGKITDNFVPLKFDVSDDDDISAERRSRYNAGTLPAVVFLSSTGRPPADRAAARAAEVTRVDHKMEPDELEPVLGPAIERLHSGSLLAAGAPCR
jgi:thioredoxin:protein disulfide reductase